MDSSRPTPGTLRVLKEERDAGVYLVRDADGGLAVRKCWRCTAWERCKYLLGLSQAQRQLRNARRLRDAGVATPEPLDRARIVAGWIEIRLRWVEGESLLERVRKASDAEQERLGDAMRGLLHALDGHGLFHRDAKLSNFVVTLDGRVVAIDPVGVRRRRDPASERDRLARSLECELTEAERRHAAPFLARAMPVERS